jgi:hypothetical protein
MPSNLGTYFFLPLQNIFNYQNSEKIVDDDEEKWDLLNKYLSFISKSRNRIDKNNNITDLNVSVKEISESNNNGECIMPSNLGTYFGI